MSLNKLGRYEIIRVLGKGAMGLVYEARDPNLDRRVAIKTIKVENLSPQAAADYEARFRTEARSAARLQHPNIVSVYDSDRDGAMAFLVMEFIQGEDLKHHLDAGKRYTLAQALAMVSELLSALAYAHQQGIVHRDVKPANLLLQADGRVKLTDFGVARIQDAGDATRSQGSMVGTLKYMSPEQVQGLPIDARADLFAVGVVLYQLLTGQRPFDGHTDFAIIQQIVGQTPALPSSLHAQLPAALDVVLMRALAKAREERFQTAQEFSQALQQACGQDLDSTLVPPAGRPETSRRGSDTSTAIATATGTLRFGGSGSTLRLDPAGTDTGSTMTQELELVYWKDIKDSGDARDLEVFLDKFPAGIYADLARRRLDRLRGAELGEGSVPTQVLELGPAWRLEHGLLPAQVPASAQAPVPATEIPPVGVPNPDATWPDGPALRAPGAPSRRPLLALGTLAGAVVLVLAVLGLKGLWAEPPGRAGVVASAVPEPSATVVAATAAVRPAAPGPASGRTDKTADARPPSPKPAAPGVLAAAVAPGPTGLPGLTDPKQACEGRVLLGFQLCLNEQCAKTAFSQHPRCVERRNQEKLRREAQDQR